MTSPDLLENRIPNAVKIPGDAGSRRRKISFIKPSFYGSLKDKAVPTDGDERDKKSAADTPLRETTSGGRQI
jgi:hypothetical protein